MNKLNTRARRQAPLHDIAVYPVIGEAGRYHVQSAGHEGILYLVDLDELVSGWCGCPHFEYRIGLQLAPEFECKHIKAAKAYRELQQREKGEVKTWG